MNGRFTFAQTTTGPASQQWRQSATTRPGVRYDRKADVLYIDLTARVSAVTSSLDAEEIFVFRSYEDGKVVGFSVPHFSSFWRSHMDDLINHLAGYVPDHRPYLPGALYMEETTLRAAQSVVTP